jgi:hypothetical protein
METIRRLGILAALGVLIFVFAPSAAQAAVMSKVQPFANLAAATQGKSMVEQTQYRRGPRCRTVYTRRCRTRYVRRCVRLAGSGRCARWVSRPVTRCYRVPRRICRW